MEEELKELQRRVQQETAAKANVISLYIHTYIYYVCMYVCILYIIYMYV
jgi:hypothetical protein